jgi:GT2 family glycosyltransferase
MRDRVDRATKSMDATIVIPTYNRKDAIIETLRCLSRLQYPSALWETIVVDDGSTDGSQEAVTKFARSSGLRIRLFEQINSGPAVARNRGAHEAQGDVLIFIDNDIHVEPGFVKDHLDTLAGNPGCWVIGRVVHPAELRRTPFGRYRDDVWEDFHREYGTDQVRETPGITAANLALPASDFKRLGGFDESFSIASCEDWELGLRARLDGIKIVYNPHIVVVHDDWATTLDRFCERQRLYSISDVLLWKKYGDNSPRARLVNENSPIALRTDRPGIAFKKAAKQVLGSRMGLKALRVGCALAESVVPDTALSRKAYNLAIGCAINRGVREGLKRYSEMGDHSASAASLEHVGH